MSESTSKIKKGFSSIELIVVIAIVSVISVVVFVVVNPIGRIQDSRNSTRWNHANKYLTAIIKCIEGNGGVASRCIGTLTPGDTYEIVSSAASGCSDICGRVSSSTGCADIGSSLGAYLKSLPEDPGGVATGHTEYAISIDPNNVVTISACSAEKGTEKTTPEISVSRKYQPPPGSS